MLPVTMEPIVDLSHIVSKFLLSLDNLFQGNDDFYTGCGMKKINKLEEQS